MKLNLSLLVALVVSITAGCAQHPSANPGMTDQARTTGQVVAKDAKDAGAAVAHGAREVGRTVKDAAVGAWDATRQGAQAVGAAASGAVSEIRR
ncbi:hypothetical protein [Sphaerotilus sp.]|uniref:hypothetical protein n=1 Tax=Sphaerotilus sp. TaxID=2093942 RepID=UPI00286D6D66|nr:hypothetical protein [Sphaerotilus sp.]